MKNLLRYKYFYLLLCFYSSSLRAQFNTIYPPYKDYSGPYIVRIQINFVERANNKWASATNPSLLKLRAETTLHQLNKTFNPYKIFFVWKNLSCDSPSTRILELNNGINPEHESVIKSTNAIDIFDEFKPAAEAGSTRGGVPSTYFHVYGQNNKGVPSTHLNILIHQMSHCFGLFDTHNSPFNCNELSNPPLPSECPNDSLLCNCCGDFVCDTRPNNLISFDCNLNDEDPIWNNYMSNPQDDACRKLFTPEQIRRMWTYLALQQNISILQNVEEQRVITTTEAIISVPPFPFGNIIIQNGAELTINRPIKMFPFAVIRVQKGGRLNLNSSITNACDTTIWKGEIIKENFVSNHESIEKKIEKVVIFPNPADNEVFIKLHENSMGHIILLKDLNGKILSRRLIEASTLSTQFAIESLMNGLYLLEITDFGGKTSFHKLIINH